MAASKSPPRRLVIGAGCLVCLPLLFACRGQESRPQASTTAAASAAAVPKVAPPASASSVPVAEAKRPLVPLYVRIPAAISPLERSDRFEGPLDALLRERKLGEVSGGGSGLKPGGGIEYVGIDVD